MSKARRGQAASFLLCMLLVGGSSTCAVAAFQTQLRLRISSPTNQLKLAGQKPHTASGALHMSLFGGGRQSLTNLRKQARDRWGATNSQSTKQSSSAATANSPTVIQWEIYVDQSKLSLDRGGSATLDAFLGLAPPSTVRVIASTLLPGAGGGSAAGATGSSSSYSGLTKKSKGPLVRCLSTDGLQCFDVSNVDSVDKVYRILTKHMQLSSNLIPYKSCECLKWKYKGNAYLEAGKFDAAVDAYNEGLRILASMKKKKRRKETATTETAMTTMMMDYQTGQQKQQEGILLLMRATAYLQRASSHKTKLKVIVKELMTMVPDAAKLKNLYEQTSGKDVSPSLSHSMFRRVLADAAQQEESFRRTQYWHGLYQYALLQAAQDVLQATQLLPDYSRGWARAGEILSELWKLSESAQYYEKAAQCDPTLQPQLKPVIDRLRKRQDLLESARAYGWSEDTLRLALDVAG